MDWEGLKIRSWKYVLLIAAGIVAFMLFNWFMKPHWTNDASIDIIIGVLLDFFVISVIFTWYNDRQAENFKEHLQNHLRFIEYLIKESQNNRELKKYFDEYLDKHLTQIQNIIKNNKPKE